MAAAKIVPAPLTRPIGAVMAEIRADYERRGKPIYFAAKPYVLSLAQVGTTDLGARYFDDDIEGMVIRLLGNLSTWRGETATRVKTELRAALAWHQGGYGRVLDSRTVPGRAHRR
jgi:hypothetical protein